MAWRLAESLKTLRTQVNALYPTRDKSSDGALGDSKHASRASDHNPNSAGVVTAVDIDADLAPGVSVGVIVSALQASRDPRIKYIIFNKQITVKGDVTKWKPYTGANAHMHHAHISVSSDAKLYDDPRPWNLGGHETPAQPQPVVRVRDLKIGDFGDDVKALQKKLGVYADGDFGLRTKKAVLIIQGRHGLREDGIVGPATRQAIGV